MMSALFEELEQEQWLEGLDLDSFIERAAYYICEINAIHPFREGNGRTIRFYIDVLSARTRGEIFSLRWSEVDWSRNFIHVINTKTGKSRIIPLNDATRDVLLRQQKRSQSEFVFVSPRTGERLRNLRNSFGKACEDAKVFNFHFHDLRHTFASRLADAGVDAFTIAELMGHSTLEMTKRYTHVTDERKRKAVAALKKPARKVVTIWSQKQKRQAV